MTACHMVETLTFKRILLPPSSNLHHNNGCSRIQCNISTFLPDYMMSHPGSSHVLHSWRQQCVNASSWQMTEGQYTIQNRAWLDTYYRSVDGIWENSGHSYKRTTSGSLEKSRHRYNTYRSWRKSGQIQQEHLQELREKWTNITGHL